MRYALHVPNFADPEELVELGVVAEKAGWDGFLLWDHVFGGPDFPARVADPWVVLGGLAVRTEHVRLGTAVTPLARRRPQKVAREAVTVDLLSHGRMVLGVGLGNPPAEEYGAFGESVDPRVRSARLDEALDVLVGLWSGEHYDHGGEHFMVKDALFLPTPVQQPRIPIWVACQLPHTAPLARAARFDGVVLTAVDEQQGVEPVTPDLLKDAMAEIARRRSAREGFDVAVVSDGWPDRAQADTFAEMGVTWVLVTGCVPHLHDLAAQEPHAVPVLTGDGLSAEHVGESSVTGRGDRILARSETRR